MDSSVNEGTMVADSRNRFLVYEQKKKGKESKVDERSTSPRRRTRFGSTFQMVRHSYRPNSVLGPPVFRPHLTDSLKIKTLKSPSVQAAIDTYTSTNPTISRKAAEQYAVKILNRLNADYNERTFRGMAYVVSKILQQLYNGIHISQQQLNRVKTIAAKAQKEKIPLILLPTHKSHIDYLVVSYVFFLCDLSLPFIAAGDNLNFPVVGNLLRNSGAFFIKRKFDNDQLYRAIFNEYIQTILSEGYNLEFFIEGGRSRAGKLLPPKMGLLSVIVDGLLSGKLKDAILVPISIGYDKVIETESYVKELLGGQKEKESLQSLLGQIKLLGLNFGRIDVRIAHPFSLKQWIEEESSARKIDPNTIKNEHKLLVQVLAYSILYRINKASVIMPTTIVVTCLLTHRGRGISRKDLIDRFKWLKKQILLRGGKVAKPDTQIESDSQLVDVSMNVLGNLIGRQKNVLEPVFTPAKRFELAYYRNQLLHLFINESVVAVSIFGTMKKHKEVFKDSLIDDVKFISFLLKMEIIYKTAEITESFEATLKQMQESRTLQVLPSGEVTIETYFQFDFLCALIWPFIDAYWLMCASFYSLFPDYIADEKAFLQRTQSLGFTLYYQGELNYYESISKEPLTNALNLFIGMDVVERRTIDDKGVNVLKLNREYQSEEKLLALIEKTGKYRRESKYSLNNDGFNAKIRNIVSKMSHSKV